MHNRSLPFFLPFCSSSGFTLNCGPCSSVFNIQQLFGSRHQLCSLHLRSPFSLPMPKSHPSFQTHLPGSCSRLEGKATLVINWLNYVMYTTMQSSQTLRSKCWAPLLEMRRQVLLPPTPVSECTWLLLPVEKLLCGELSRGSSHTPAGMEDYLETSTVFSVNIFINSFQDVWIMQSSSRQIRGPKHAKSGCHLTAAGCTKWELLYMFSHSTRAPHLP